MHCEFCGVENDRGVRCKSCRATLGGLWIVLLASLLWFDATALYVVVRQVVYPEVAQIYDGLGSQPPIIVRVYFALSDRLFYPMAIAGALLAPLALLLHYRRNSASAYRYTKLYAATAATAVGWSLLALLAWYVAMQSVMIE
jgi:hypothetical protein